MATNISRRQLADYVIDHLIAKKSADQLSQSIAAALIASKSKKDTELLMDDISRELENRGLLAQARVTTATPLNDRLRQQLRAQIQKIANVKKVILKEEIDKAIIGGLRVETANHSWDKTITRQLIDIKGGI